MSRSCYTCELFDQAEDLDGAGWWSVCDPSANPTMDPRFLNVVRASLPTGGRCWAAVVRDASGQPMAVTYFTLYLLDGALVLPRTLRRATEAIRRAFPRYLYFRVLICGHPIGVGGSSLQTTAEVDVAGLVDALDDAAECLAKSHRASLVVFKEFPADEAERLAGLEARGYTRNKSVTTWQLSSAHSSFEEYYSSRSKRTRANMRKYFSKLQEAGLEVLHRRGGETAAAMITDDVYQLYRNVVARAEFQFEVVTLEFFRELARQFPDECSFTFVSGASGVSGFCCGLGAGTHHMLLYCGIDYTRNEEAAIYFNTLYRGLAAALDRGVHTINVGQSADEFKRRLGCEGSQLFVFTRPTTLLFKLLHRMFSHG